MSRGTSEEIRARARKPGSLMGSSEVSSVLAVPRSTIGRWLRESQMPMPEDVIAAGPVWRATVIEKFAEKKRQEREEMEREIAVRAAEYEAKKKERRRRGASVTEADMEEPEVALAS